MMKAHWSRGAINETQALQGFQLLRYGAAILVSILLAKSALSQTEIANYEYLLYIGTTLSFFWVNAFVTSLISVYPKLNKEEQPELVFQAFLIYLLLGAILCGSLYLLSSILVPLLTNRPDLPYLNWFLLFLFFNFPTHLIDSIYLLRKEPITILGYGLLAFGGYVLALLIPIWWGGGLGWGIKAITCLAFIRLMWLLFLLPGRKRLNWRSTVLKRYWGVAIPLVGYSFMGGFAPVFDNWLVGWYYEEDRLFAIFRYGARELPLALALTAGLSTSLIPVLSQQLSLGLEELKDRSRRLLHWLFPISILLMLSADFLFPIVFNPDFADSAGVFKVYLLLVISRVLLPTTVLHALEETRVIFRISVLELLLNVVLSCWFVSFWGLEGVAFATVLAFLFEKVAMMFYLHQKHDISVGEYMAWPWIVFYGTCLVAVYLLMLG